MVVRANLEISEKPAGDKRMIFSGTIDQIKEDIAGCNDIGAHELFFDPTFSPGAQSLDRWLALMERFGNCGAVCKLAGHRAQDFRLCWLSGVICGGTSHSLFLNPGFFRVCVFEMCFSCSRSVLRPLACLFAIRWSNEMK